MKDSLFVKILMTVIVGILCLSLSLGGMNLLLSKEMFADNYSDSQEKVFLQIDKELYEFFSDVTEIADQADRSWAVREYLTEESPSINDEMKTIYHMKEHMKSGKVEKNTELGVMLFGDNGKSYIMSNSVLDVPSERILLGRAAIRARENPGKLVCEYEERGYTDDQKSTPVLVMARTLDFRNGMIIITISEADFRKMYEHFASDISDMAILNQDGEVVSTNNPNGFEEDDVFSDAFNKEMEDGTLQRQKTHHSWNVTVTLSKKIHGTGFVTVGEINPNMAFLKQYNIGAKMLLTVLITGVIGFVIFIFIRQQTKPLLRLSDKMQLVQEGNMEEYVEVEGPREVRELTKTYNSMLEKINLYIEEKMKIQEEKRKAEIYALQMQINPHYMYNTLASIKWLMWQGDVKKSTAVMLCTYKAVF